MTLTYGGPVPLTAADISAAIDRADAIAAAHSCGWVCWCGQSRAATHVHLSPAVSTRAACAARLADGPLACTRLTPHEVHHGCTYESTSGVPDAAKEE